LVELGKDENLLLIIEESGEVCSLNVSKCKVLLVCKEMLGAPKKV